MTPREITCPWCGASIRLPPPEARTVEDTGEVLDMAAVYCPECGRRITLDVPEK